MPCPDFRLDFFFIVPICLAPCLAVIAVSIILLWPQTGPLLLRRRVLVSVAVFLGIFLAAFLTGPIVQHFVDRTAEARAGAYAIFERLPQIANVEQQDVQDATWLDDIGGCCDSVGRLYILLGTPLPVTETLDSYGQQLTASGWFPSGTQSATTRVLTRHVGELIVIERAGDGGSVWDYGRNPIFAATKRKYRNVLDVRVDYVLASGWPGCEFRQ